MTDDIRDNSDKILCIMLGGGGKSMNIKNIPKIQRILNSWLSVWKPKYYNTDNFLFR